MLLTCVVLLDCLLPDKLDSLADDTGFWANSKINEPHVQISIRNVKPDLMHIFVNYRRKYKLKIELENLIIPVCRCRFHRNTFHLFIHIHYRPWGTPWNHTECACYKLEKFCNWLLVEAPGLRSRLQCRLKCRYLPLRFITVIFWSYSQLLAILLHEDKQTYSKHFPA
jgi:hypothetical protein